MQLTNMKQMQVLPLSDVKIEDRFWSEYIRLVREVVVPYQWETLNDRVPGAEPSRAIQNLRIAAGEESGEFYGMVFQDSDVAKWLEAAGYLLQSGRDPELERIADGLVDLIVKAQREDGYLNTYYMLKEPGNEWTNLCECHELYTAGHLIEGAVAYYQATGKRAILDVACKFADYIDSVFGPEPGKLQGYDGHQEIELALVKLYETTGVERYLRLSQFFLDERGKEPHFYDQEYEGRGGTNHWGSEFMIKNRSYSQAQAPVREQTSAEGHAVRLVYMCTAMADVAAKTGDSELLQACRRLWNNIVTKRMYITGGIGSMAQGESFTLDYDLPNDTAYAETCASIGLIFFAQRMLRIEPHRKYADVMERALYNTVLGGMAKDGRHFFYVNPLEVWPDACGKSHVYDHVKPVRQGWFGCACCPPNVARLLASLGQYMYTANEKSVYAHLYVGGEANLTIQNHKVKLIEQSELPWEGRVQIAVEPDSPVEFELMLRIPEWTDRNGVMLFVNGEQSTIHTIKGYAIIHRTWKAGDMVELELPMPVTRMKGHPLLRETVGKVALQRGPLVYCLEEADNGKHLHQIYLQSSCELSVAFEPELLGGVCVIRTEAERLSTRNWEDVLYKEDARSEYEPAAATFIPYFAWANRGEGEMTVWVRERI